MLAFSVAAQPQNTFYRAWVKNGGSVAPTFAQPVVTAVNGSAETYVAGSVTNSAGTQSLLLTKYSNTGSLLWSRTFDVNTAGNTYAGSIALDPSGNVLVAGSTYNGSTYNYDLFVVKYNSSGTKQWHQLYNGAGNFYDFGAAVECSAAGDVYVTGGTSYTTTNLNAVTIRYNSSGTAQWTKTWDNVSLSDAGGTISIGATSITVTGFTQTNTSNWEYMALSYTISTGQLSGASTTTLGGTSIDRISDAAMDAAGNMYITGALGTTSNGFDIKTVKLNASLTILWTATWNGAANLNDAASSLVVDASGNVYVAGHSTNADNTDAVLIKYTSSGAQSWVQIHNGGGNDAYADVVLTVDGDIFVGGYTSLEDSNRDFFVALYSTSGSKRWSDAYNGYPNRDDEIKAVRPDGSGNFLVTGSSVQWDGSQQVLTAKYSRYSQVLPQNEAVNAPFIENRGQVLNTGNRQEPDVRYYSRSNYPNLYVFDDKVSFVFAHIDTVATSLDTMTRLDLSFKNSFATTTAGLERQEDFHNYYLGHIPEGRERTPLENKALHPGIYTNIDALYGQGQDGFFLRLICKPGSNPGHINLKFAGQTGLSIQSDGSLKVETQLEDLILPAPTAILSDASGVESVPGWSPSFVINSDTSVSFSTGSVTSGSSLILGSGRQRYNPNGECDYYWSTYFGETGNETALGNDVDASGNMYFTGHTSSVLFPVTDGAQQAQLQGAIDAYAACFKQLDERKWATFYGGTENASGENDLAIDQGLSIKWDFSNNKVYFVGRTSSQNFPLKQVGGYFNSQTKGNIDTWSTRGFIVKLEAEFGKLDWATFFGDSKKKYDAVTALHISSGGNILVGGYSFEYDNTQTAFPYFPSNTPGLTPHIQTSGAVYMAEFNTSNEQVWATKLTNELELYGASIPCTLADIAEDGDGNLYAVGHVFDDGPNDFIPMGINSVAFSGFTAQVFIFRFSQAKKIEWSSYLGGDNLDLANSIVCPPETGRCYVTGTTFSSNFPTVAVGNPSDPLLNDLTLDGTQDIFISQFGIEDDGSEVMYWSRYLGGPGATSSSEGSDSQPFVSLYSDNGSTGNATTAMGPDKIGITGIVENNFSPLTPSSCTFYYGNINRGGVVNGNDAIITLLKNRKVNFSTYWGGEAIGGGSQDFGITIAHGVSTNGKSFVLLGGSTNSKQVGVNGKTIPVCREQPFPGSYYNNNLIGGIVDAFISKIYYAECITTDVAELATKIQNLEIQPNPAGAYISIKLPEINQEGFTINLYDVTGKEVTSLAKPATAVVEDQVQVQIGLLPPGLYVVIVQTAGQTFSGKFIKQ
jgi:hypothetical protein